MISNNGRKFVYGEQIQNDAIFTLIESGRDAF